MDLTGGIEGARRRQVLIVGGGVAAQSCAFELRASGYEGAITLISDEDVLPYDRTLLSKALLDDDGLNHDRLVLEPRERYDELEIGLELGARAMAVDVAASSVTLADGRDLPYDGVVLCTGGRARLPRRLQAPGVLTLRGLPDAQALRERLAGCARLLIVGGGFIGAELATTAAAHGIDVTMVEQQQVPLAHMLGSEVGERVATLQRALGVDIRVGVAVDSVARDRHLRELTLTDGAVLRGDLVVVGVGMEPNAEWLGAAVQYTDGIVTDATGTSEIPNVFAAGDCSRWWNPRYGMRMRVEHWDTASKQGRAAARAVLGSDEPFAPVPFFWSYQDTLRFHWAGYAPRWDAVEIDDVPDVPGAFVARYFADDELVAVFGANAPRVVAVVRRDLEARYREGERV